ncbi:MAG: hypothetical protein OHK0039_16150 [Bacteroidia bacterium]
MLKKLAKWLPFLVPAVKVLHWALLLALLLMFVFIGLVHLYNEVNSLSWSVWLTGYILSVVGFYITWGTAAGIRKWLSKEQ